MGLAAQVGINTSSPSPASVLDVKSSSNNINFGGFLPPKVTTAQRNSIPATAADDGLMVFLSQGTTRCLQVWDGTQLQWENLYCIPNNVAPVASNVTFSGSLQQGNPLIASFTYTDADGDPPGAHIYTWYRANNISGSGQISIQTGTSNSYTPVVADVGKFIAVEVTPVAASGTSPGLPVISNYQGPISALLDLAVWEFAGNMGDEVTVNASTLATNIQSGVISRGSGISPSVNFDRFNADNYAQPSLVLAVANNDYIQFTVTPNAGKMVTVSEVFLRYQRSPTGPVTGTLRSSVDGYTANIITITSLPVNGGNYTIDTTGFGITNISGTVTFRFYLYGNTNAGGTGGFEGLGSDLIIRGSVN